jgi:tetratricopeptide (TPR) repeat protein
MSQSIPDSQSQTQDNLIKDTKVIGDLIFAPVQIGTQIVQISITEIKTRQLITTSPYKGLSPFEAEDKDNFFGRDQFLAGLVNELEHTNLLLLLGASGSGKSSIVRAGLVPYLTQKWGSKLVNLTFTPDQDPFESLYASLLQQRYKQSEVQIVREQKADTFIRLVKALKQPEAYWFIFIDQFEELFTTTQEGRREEFIASITRLSKVNAPFVKIIMTMRADFLDRLSPYSELINLTNQHRPMITEMQRDELRLVIEQPAAHHGVVFEEGLVEEIIKDVQSQAGYLPLLQYALNQLWEIERQDGGLVDRTLNTDTYRSLGGVRGTLQKRVEQIYQDLSKQEQQAAQRIFLKIVDIGGDQTSETDWKPVRRRASRSEFSAELEQTVLVKLINENLLVSDGQPQAKNSTVEITHEILLTSWPTLKTWIQENRHAVALRNRLNGDVANWQAKKADDELWSGSKLEKVLELQKDQTFIQVLEGFSQEANQFIAASMKKRNHQRRRTVALWTGISMLMLIIIALYSSLGTPFVANFFNEWAYREYENKQFQSATQKYTLAIQLGRSDALIYYNRGLAYEELSDLNYAYSDYEYAIKINPKSAPSYNNLARLYILKRDYSGAVELLQNGLRIPAKDLDSYKDLKYSMLKNLGWAQFMLLKYLEAEKSLREAISIDSLRGSADCLLAKVLEAQNPRNNVKEEWNKCLNFENPGVPEEREWLNLARRLKS